jgi:adenylosuccinate synthase
LADGTVTDRFIPDAVELGMAQPVYTELEGFGDEISGAKKLADLPRAALAYVEFVAKFVGVPVDIVSVGPGREQTIMC